MPHSARHTPHTIRRTLYTVLRTPYSVGRILYTAHTAPYTIINTPGYNDSWCSFDSYLWKAILEGSFCIRRIRQARHLMSETQYSKSGPKSYCKHRNFSDLTIITIIATQRKPLLKLSAIFSTALYVIYQLERNR